MNAPRHSLPPELPSPAAMAPPLHRPPSLANALGMIVLYFLLQVGFGIAVSMLMGLAYGIAHRGTAATHVGPAVANADVRSALVVLVLLGAAAVTLWLAHWLWPRPWTQAKPPGFGFAAPSSASWYAIAMVVGLAVPLAGSKLTELIAHGHAIPQEVKQLGGNARLVFRVALTLTVISIGPVVEELLFRGVLLSALLHRLRAVWAMAASAALFALVHLPELHWLWYALPNLMLLGMALAWLRLRSGSLWPAVVAHGCNNLLAMAALFAALHQPG